MINVASLISVVLLPWVIARPPIRDRTIPKGAITVGANHGAKYSTISAALNDTSSNTYYIYPGNYTEAIVITRAVTIYGATCSTMDYSSNSVTVSRDAVASAVGGNKQSAAIRVQAVGVSLYNLNIENTYGKPVDQAQAIALSVENGQFACYACQLRGYQDTFLANTGTQFVAKSLIAGAVDFIFGQQGSLWITDSTIQTLGNGYITASGRSTNDTNWYVINSSTVTGIGSVYLGRPWRNYARVVFQNTFLPSTIQPAGWVQWSAADPRTNETLLGEYHNRGPGAWNASARASFAVELTAPISISTVLGNTSWIDHEFL